MSTQLVKIEPTQLRTIQHDALVQWSSEEKDLIKSLYAKDSTDAEFKVFLYNALHRGLDPLRNQIYFIKRAGKAAFQVAIDGYRAIAQRTGKLKGIQRGIRREGNEVIGWAKVYRSDWEIPAYEEVSLKEYRGNTPTWNNLPETMLKKVAETAALRMAFPDELGGTYGQEEMDQADRVSAAEESTKRLEITSAIGKIMKTESLSPEDIQEITGLETLRGINSESLELAHARIMEHLMENATYQEANL